MYLFLLFWKEIHVFASFAHIICLWLPLDFHAAQILYFLFRSVSSSVLQKSQWLKSWPLNAFVYLLMKGFLTVTCQFTWVYRGTGALFFCQGAYCQSGRDQPSSSVHSPLLWDSAFTWLLASHLLPNASKVHADPQFIVQHKTILDSPQFRQEEQHCHLCPGPSAQANIAYRFASRLSPCKCSPDTQQNSYHINTHILLKPASCYFWHFCCP